jgi:hypothetical protein
MVGLAALVVTAGGVPDITRLSQMGLVELAARMVELTLAKAVLAALVGLAAALVLMVAMAIQVIQVQTAIALAVLLVLVVLLAALLVLQSETLAM